VRARSGRFSVVVVLALVCWSAIGAGFAIAKPGQLDHGFGTHGKAITWVGEIDAFAEAQQPPRTEIAAAGGGRIVAGAGQTVVRYTAAGRLDPSFGQRGRVVLPVAVGYTFELSGIAIDSRGRVLVAGSTTSGVYPDHDSSATIYRYLPGGELDPDFGDNGALTTDFGLPPSTERPDYPTKPSFRFELPVVYVLGLAVDSRDRPVLTGSWVPSQTMCYPFYEYEDGHKGYVARLRPGGALDTSFAGTGVLADAGADEAVEPRVGEDGKILYASDFTDCVPRGRNPNGGLHRLLASGQHDPGFGSAGQVYDPTFYEAPATAVDRFGRIFLAGFGSEEAPPGSQGWLIRRLSPRGFPSPGFGGSVRLPSCFNPASLAVDRQGRALLATSEVVETGFCQFLVIRRNRDGSADMGFGRGGKVYTEFPGSAAADAILVGGRDRIVVAGTTTDPFSRRYGLALVRYRGGGP